VAISIIIVGVLLALLVWAGRKPARVSGSGRLLAALFAAMAAVAAVVSALRGGWIPSLILVGLSALIGRNARTGPRPASNPGGGADLREGGMSLHEARAVLGVDATAGRPEILAAYRRLIQRAHPDHGGSAGLAAQLNAARDRLLGKGGGA
jgi:hypothetical protein